MATVPSSTNLGTNAIPIAGLHRPPSPHRIAEVRNEQGISLRTVSRRTGVEVSVLRAQEEGLVELTLADLHRWQQALEVPIADLLQEGVNSLSPPVRQRAQLVRIMKTARSIAETAPSERVSRMAEMLRDQLIELMPELTEVVAWPNQGSRRPRASVPKILQNEISLGDVASNLNDG
jgi:transcriptional regulator with XRE-family HTH domain